jgi:hypothetical protein
MMKSYSLKGQGKRLRMSEMDQDCPDRAIVFIDAHA